jgi:hypothetical protein
MDFGSTSKFAIKTAKVKVKLKLTDADRYGDLWRTLGATVVDILNMYTGNTFSF